MAFIIKIGEYDGEAYLAECAANGVKPDTEAIFAEGTTRIPPSSEWVKNIIHFDSLSFPESVQEICEGAFDGLDQLNELYWPASVPVIPPRMFKSLPKLIVNMPEGVIEIGDYAFFAHGRDVNIPDSVTRFGNYCFSEFEDGIADINWNPINTVSIGGYAFYENRRLQISTQFPNLVSISGQAFEGCEKLLFIDLPQKLISIGTSAFEENTFNRLTITKTVQELSPGAFALLRTNRVSFDPSMDYVPSGCFIESKLTEIEFIAPIREIQAEAFKWCEYLTEIVIPNSVKRIENAITDNFERVVMSSGIEEIDRFGDGLRRAGTELVFEGNEHFDYIDRRLIERSTKRLIADLNFPCDSIELPSMIKAVGAYAYEGSGIRKITIKDENIILEPNSFAAANKLVLSVSRFYYEQNGLQYLLQTGAPVVRVLHNDKEIILEICGFVRSKEYYDFDKNNERNLGDECATLVEYDKYLCQSKLFFNEELGFQKREVYRDFGILSRMSRLAYPFELSPESRKSFTESLKGHEMHVLEFIFLNSRWDLLDLAGPHFLQPQTIEDRLHLAIADENAELTAILLQYKQKHIGFENHLSMELDHPTDHTEEA